VSKRFFDTNGIFVSNGAAIALLILAKEGLVTRLRKYTSFVVVVMGLLGTVLFLTGCPTTNQEKSLTQIRSQLSVLSTEMRESFGKSEEEKVTLYKQLNDDITLLQKNQADLSSVTADLSTVLTAIDAKMDEYNTRMDQMNERLKTVETALTERITALSDQVSDMGREPTIRPTPTPAPSETPLSNPTPQDPTVSSGNPTVTPTPIEGETNPDSEQTYQKAYLAYVNGNFDVAIAGFQRYLELYPDSKRSDLAQYWIAESFFSLGEFDTALKEYDTLITQYPSSDRIPAAYFSKADAYLKLDRQIEAISHLKYIVEQFPNSPVAQRAAERLKSIEQ
jgi:tol-pal system protein YbgF